VSKPRGRPFEPGNKAGRGRPKGSRNRDSGPVKAIFDEYAPHLARKVVAKALEGDPQALRICMDRIMPVPRDAGIPIHLPKIKSMGDVADAAGKVTRDMGKGNLSPSEGERMMNVLETHARLIENSETEKRVEKLEEHMAATKTPYPS